MPFALPLLTLLGCVEPPILEPVEEKLADRVMEVAEPQIRIFLSVAGVVAETCLTDSMSSYVFEGAVPKAFGVTAAQVETSASGDHTWTFPHVGIDGAEGELVLVTDSGRTSFSATYTAPDNTLMDGEFHILSCDPPESTARRFAADSGVDTGGTDTSGSDTGDTATDTGSTSGAGYVTNVSGNMDATTTTESDHLDIDGDKPYSSLTWAPPTAAGPAGGWIHWQDAVEDSKVDDEVTLEGATNIDYTSATWPGIASNARWQHDVSVKLP